MASIELVMVIVVAVVSVLIAGNGGGDWGGFLAALLLLMVPASIPMVRYEVAATARRGQTFAKAWQESG